MKYFIIMTRFLSSDTQNLSRSEAYHRTITEAAAPMKIVEYICIKNKNEEQFFKFHFIYDNL